MNQEGGCYVMQQQIILVVFQVLWHKWRDGFDDDRFLIRASHVELYSAVELPALPALKSIRRDPQLLAKGRARR